MKGKIAIAVTLVASGLLLFVSIFTGPSIFAAPSDKATYVGPSACKKCHIKQFKMWEKTPHAKNFEILKMMRRETDTECVKCHSTGYGEASGFVSIASTPDLANTTCEACHGPGSKHITVDIGNTQQAKATITKPTGECVKCHNPHILREEEAGKAALPVLKKKLEELQKQIQALEAK